MLAPLGMDLYTSFINSSHDREILTWRPFTWKNLYFKNPLGIAGGMDKNAWGLKYWDRIGCGFMEIGTITPHPQGPNPGKILDRDWKGKNLWNKMGFPNEGAQEIFFNILNTKSHGKDQLPLWLNIGKNRWTSNEDAWKDYVKCTQILKPIAHGFVINVSSPNTKNLRDLQNNSNELKLLIGSVLETAHPLPVLLKLSPDLEEGDLRKTLETSVSMGINGFILTNTTLQRPASKLHKPFPAEGGVSGSALKELSVRALKMSQQVVNFKKHDLLLISTGGILSKEDVLERLDLGAHLVQVYSALIFNGPSFFRKLLGSFKDVKDVGVVKDTRNNKNIRLEPL